MGWRRWSWAGCTLIALVVGCADPTAFPDPIPSTAPPPAPEPDPPSAGDAPIETPPPAVGIACDAPNARSCDGAAPLRCVAGSGGAKWMADDPCYAGSRCVADWGCLPLPACTELTLLSCVGQELFVCEAEGEARAWQHVETCPDALTCVDGRGCPNPHGVGTPCSFVEPSRCTPGGQLMECTLDGLDAVWSSPERCPSGQHCVQGRGCRDDDENPDRRPPAPRPEPAGGRN